MRRAFTLIEVIVSVALLSLVILYMYDAIDMLKMSNKTYEKHYKIKHDDTKIQKTLSLDLMQATNIKVYKNEFDRLTLETKNSHFDIEAPYICYLVRDNMLYRLESNKPIYDKITDDMLKNIKFEILKESVERFKVFKADASALISLDEMLLEVTL